MSDAEKLAAAAMSMEDEAFAWHQWEDTRRPFWSWEDLKRLLERFGPRDEEEMPERFFSLWQEGGVCEYRRDFERVVSTIDNIPQCLLEGQFINWLHPGIRAELKAHRPTGLGCIMLMAQKLER